ncbi:MAG: signal peptidase II [Clostridiaceae bacterium]
MEIIIIIIGLLIDRITKVLAIDYLGTGDVITVIDKFAYLEYLENRGAAFGIFQGKTILLAIFSFIIIIGLMFYLFKFSSKLLIERIALSLIISGALGNLYDRVIHNYVVDFIKLQYLDKYVFPTFNFADVWVCVGTFFLGIYLLRDIKNEKV